MIRGCW